jgi:hypothetical protein
MRHCPAQEVASPRLRAMARNEAVTATGAPAVAAPSPHNASASLPQRRRGLPSAAQTRRRPPAPRQEALVAVDGAAKPTTGDCDALPEGDGSQRRMRAWCRNYRDIIASAKPTQRLREPAAAASRSPVYRADVASATGAPSRSVPFPDASSPGTRGCFASPEGDGSQREALNADC